MNQRKAGALLSLTLVAVNAGISVFYVPMLLKFLTVSEYGIFELGGAVIVYMSMMDLGLSVALSRYHVLYQLQSPQRLPSLLTTSLAIYAGMTVVSLLAVGALWLSLDAIFGTQFSETEMELTRNVVLLLGVNSLFAVPAAWAGGLLVASEQFVFLRLWALARSVMQFGLTTIVLFLTGNPVAAVAVQVAIGGLSLIITYWYAWTRSGLKLVLGKWEFREAKNLLGFSSLLAVGVIFDLVFWRTGQFVLGSVGGAALISVYAVVSRIVTGVFLPLSTAVSSVFLPKLTTLVKQAESGGEINSLFARVGRYQAILVWGMIGGFTVLGSPLLDLWAGTAFADAYYCALVLMLSLSISSVQSLGLSILQARNQLKFRTVLQSVMLLALLITMVPVSTKYGVVGLCTLAAVILFLGTGPVMNYYYHRKVGLNVFAFFRVTAPVAIPMLAAAVTVGALQAYIKAPVSWASLGLYGALFLSLDLALTWQLTLADEEKQAVRGLFSRRA